MRAISPTERYVILCEGEPVYTTDHAEDLVTYLWGRMIRRHPGAPYRYTVLDYEVPHVVDTGDLCAWLARLPVVGERCPRACVPLKPRHQEQAQELNWWLTRARDDGSAPGDAPARPMP